MMRSLSQKKGVQLSQAFGAVRDYSKKSAFSNSNESTRISGVRGPPI